jgi:hypothetical protein
MRGFGEAWLADDLPAVQVDPISCRVPAETP